MKELIEKHFQQNLRCYFLLAGVLLLGILVGTLFVNNQNEEQKNEINIYLASFINELKQNNNINYMSLLKDSAKRNLEFIALVVILGFSVWGEISGFSLIGYKGFCLGYSIASAIAILGVGKGLVFALSLIIFGEILFIPAFFCITILSIKTYRKLISRNYEDKRVLIIRYVICLLIDIALVISSSLLKTYISSNLFLMLVKYF